MSAELQRIVEYGLTEGQVRARFRHLVKNGTPVDRREVVEQLRAERAEMELSRLRGLLHGTLAASEERLP